MYRRVPFLFMKTHVVNLRSYIDDDDGHVYFHEHAELQSFPELSGYGESPMFVVKRCYGTPFPITFGIRFYRFL